MRNNNLLSSGFLLFCVTVAIAVFAMVPSSFAAHHGAMAMPGAAGHQCQHSQGHGGKQGQMGHHGRGAMKGRHGGGHGQGGHHGKKLLGPHWKTTLSPEQVQELDRLRVEYAKLKAPLKAKAKAIKLELAVLATADEPDVAGINARIDQLLTLKRQMMGHKYGHIAAKRRVLTPERRVSFDMEVLKRTKHKGKKRH